MLVFVVAGGGRVEAGGGQASEKTKTVTASAPGHGLGRRNQRLFAEMFCRCKNILCGHGKGVLCGHGKGRRGLSAEHSLRITVRYGGPARGQARKLL